MTYFNNSIESNIGSNVEICDDNIVIDVKKEDKKKTKKSPVKKNKIKIDDFIID
jgi:hypothetical protein